MSDKTQVPQTADELTSDTDLAGVSGGDQIGGAAGNIPGRLLPFHVDEPEDLKRRLADLNQRWKARSL